MMSLLTLRTLSHYMPLIDSSPIIINTLSQEPHSSNRIAHQPNMKG